MSTIMLNGCQVHASPVLTERKEVHRQERKWARRVTHQRERRFDIKYANVPMNSIIKIGDQLFAHPVIIEKIKAEMDKGGRA